MTSQDTQPTAAQGRLLRRRTRERVIGGVAGGLGDYFNVDPLLIRIGFVGLIIFGGAGLALYLIAWLLMPAEGRDVSVVEAVVRSIGLTPQRIGWIAIVVAAVVVVANLTSSVSYPLDGSGYPYGYYGAPLGISAPVVFWAVVVVVAGYLVIRRRETSPATASIAQEQDSPTGEGLIRRVGPTLGRIATFALAGVAVVLLINSWNLNVPGDGGLLWAIAVIGVGFFLIRRPDTAPAVSGVASAPAVIAPHPAAAPPRPRSPLAWYACGAVLLGIGLLALVSQVAHVAVAPGQFFGAALAILGIGLIIGAWWGRARILILPALVLVPLAVAASFMTAPLEGGIGAMRFTPANAAELRPDYRVMGGTLTLDLTSLSIASQPVHIAASVAAGQLVVIVPPDASVELRARVGAGQVTVFDAFQSETILTNAGTSLDEHYVRRRDVGPTYILDLHGGIGEVFVTNSSVNR